MRDVLMRGKLTITCPICGKGEELGLGTYNHIIR